MHPSRSRSVASRSAVPALALALLAGGCTHRPPQADPPPAAMNDPAPGPAEPSPGTPDGAATATATLGAGCFWCIEAVLERVDGVLAVDSGYMGGHVERPTYRQVCAGDTGHAEVVQVTFDPARIDYEQLLDWFFRAHDPTTPDRQGNDVGPQYRSVIFWHDDEQHAAAERAKVAAQEMYSDPIVTEISKASMFWPAEEHHQDFFRRNPEQAYCRAIIPPKLKKLGLDRKQ